MRLDRELCYCVPAGVYTCMLHSLSILVLYIFSAAWIDKCRPDILISESTYATTIRDSKRCRERDFLKKVHESIERGGKVMAAVRLTPYFDFWKFWFYSCFYILSQCHFLLSYFSRSSFQFSPSEELKNSASCWKHFGRVDV